MNLEKAEDLILKVEEHKYQAHENIFESVRLKHPSDDFTKQEYFLNEAVKKYVDDLEEKNKEPKTMTVTIFESEKGGYDTKVRVNKYRNTKGVDGS